MIGSPALGHLDVPAADGNGPQMATISQSVLCERCGRSVLVALSSLHPPSFQRVDEQVGCPEIQERRGKSEGGLLLMMCGALKRSLDVGCNSAEVEAAAQDRRWRILCRIPGVSGADYSPQEARRRAEIFLAHGNENLAVRLRAAARKAERRQAGRTRSAVGIGALVIAAAAGSWLLVRQSPMAPLQPVESFNAVPDARAAEPPVPGAVVTQVAPPASDPPAVAGQEAPSEPRPSPSPETAQDKAPEAEAAAASTVETTASTTAISPAEPVPASDPAAVSDTIPPTEQKLRLPDLVMVAGGSFAMGGSENSELPVHQVTVKPFALGKFPVTVGEWKECVAAKVCADLATGADDDPVTNVSYDDAQNYLTWLSGVIGKPFRLPSEAEWEYAARGNQRTKFWWGDQLRTGMANCKGCNGTDAAAQPVKVGSFQANPFGLFDMGGCVDQWVADSWHKNYQGAPADGSAWVDPHGFAHVIRSGSWKNDPSYVRAGSRDHYDARIRYPTHGFRVALSLN